ncbi:exocyst complex component EXO70H1 [Rhodamnia argentea]|uniref:Exocyst subunit Exo70 family protein n=1 Tax=Rhodamnia argentea TaxID=178133 RepID=A0A8B8QGF2_9MYRT|nr:exocyst complex component EXO70H1 [Rhodamnia argentea]
MRSPFFKPSPSPSRSPLRFTPASSPMRHTLSESLVQENIDRAEPLIAKWDPSHHTSSSLYRDSRWEAKQFLKSVGDLQAAMIFFVREDSASDKLVRAQFLMQTAMKRLEKEFYLILSTNRQYLDPESVSLSTRSSSVSEGYEDESEDDLKSAGDGLETLGTPERTSSPSSSSATVMADLKAIADCMISSGYGQECVKVYKIVRKSVVDEALYRLGLDRTLTPSQIKKMDWKVLEAKIKCWLRAVKFAVTTVFYGERILCDHVFVSSLHIRESCFSEITRENAIALFGFAESVGKCKKSPEKMFRALDLYEGIANIWPVIKSTFSSDSSSAVRSQAVNALIKLGDAARLMLADFEAAIQKDSSKAAVPGGGVHPLTRYVMNYLTFLADYSEVLTDIVADWPVEAAVPDLRPDASPMSARLAWLVLVLLCKLDAKAQRYKDVALSYLFLANNLDYVVVKVRQSRLRYLLGEDWVTKQEAKVRQYAANYEKMGWSKVLESLPEAQPPAAEMSMNHAKESFRSFNAAFEEAYKRQIGWVVADPKLRDEMKVSLAKKLVPRYREFYETHGAPLRRDTFREGIVRFAPEDLGNYLSDLFHGSEGSSFSSSHSSSSSTGSSNKGQSH